MMNTLAYLCYGKPRYRQEVMFSILSAYRWMQNEPKYDIIVYTDAPEEFSWLNVTIRPVTDGLMARWMGKASYRFRAKAACIVDLLEEDRNVLFVDGDTYFRADPAKLFGRIAPGSACLHVRELGLSQRKGTAGVILGQLLATGAVRDLAGEPVALHDGEGMWNSGVIGVSSKDRALIQGALHLMDEIWQRERRVHTIEQFAIGHMLIHNNLTEADDVVFHYWQDVFRVPFLAGLPDLLERARAMPLVEAARWSYQFRPVASRKAKVMAYLKTAMHRIGMDRRGVRVSA